ncbi:DUF4884 domain-containing protein [Bacteroides thetaiotaomicron]|uniref:DUF4884 domain-containing protein n=1 Tax=Bacteroides thetaiotaomicron TaxID=818 RepID=UPI000E4924ED|nr:DUF4884 domain-containing protein [Bacteroides thetaiotaomicron]RHJ68442.1 DUF4884 domain-containing protein [Bacteroides thetaiotaomicron]
MKQIIAIIITSCLLMGCTRDTIKTNDEVITEKEVKFLFEYDGVKVYRFHDCGRYIYFTNTSGKVEYERTCRNGKIVKIEKVQTLCN